MRNFDSAPPLSSPHSTSEAVQQNENKPLKNYDLVQAVDGDAKSVSVDENKVVTRIVTPNEGVSNDGVLGSKKVEKSKLQKLLEDLSDSDVRRIERYIKEGKPDKASLHIAGLGLSMTSQEELIKHFTQYLEDGINRISWTGKRLAYAVAILEYTLDSEGNNNITSVENLIQNYLVFCKTFKEYEEDKIPRYGQFSYVMRSIFAGIRSKEEIVERIQKHKTFGQRAELTEEELKELHSSAQVVRKDFLEAKRKKLDLDRSMNEALLEEHEEKGRVWTWKFSAPREYEFPNYTFQTGEKKGKNKTVGRSSWEPLFEAYADTVNKKIEDRISKKTNISEEEKERRIKETRIELLYETFEFPVGIRTDKNGNSKPIVYILDFVDINRWRGIEIKGPLTPKAAEKIRLFQKYYVEGDFSDLPKDEQIIMMEYVQDALDGVRDYCIKNKYPVFNQFSSLDVLGMYKWDYDLNNFNKYEEARYMKELSVKERQQLQKGFIQLIEDRIKTRKDFPDIRPQEYVQSDRLPKIEGQNKKDAKKEGAVYFVENPVSSKPFKPILVAEEVTKDMSTGVPYNDAAILRVSETLPFSNEERLVIRDCEKFTRIKATYFDVLDTIFTDKSVTESVVNGNRKCLISLESDELEDLISIDFHLLKKYFMNSNLDENQITNYMLFESFCKKAPSRKEKGLIVDSKLLDDLCKIKINDLCSVAISISNIITEKYSETFNNRLRIVGNIVVIDRYTSTNNILFTTNKIEEILGSYKNKNLTDSERKHIYTNIAKKIFLQDKAFKKNWVTLLSIFTDYIENSIVPRKRYTNLYDFVFIIKTIFSKQEAAAKFFSENCETSLGEEEYLKIINKMNSFVRLGYKSWEETDEYMESNKKIIISMIKAVLEDGFGGKEKLKLMCDKFERDVAEFGNN